MNTVILPGGTTYQTKRSKPLPHERCTETHIDAVLIPSNGRRRAHYQYRTVRCPLFAGHVPGHEVP